MPKTSVIVWISYCCAQQQTNKHNVTYLLKARIVESQQPAFTGQQPLNNNIRMVLAAQSVPMSTYTTMQSHCNGGTLFSTRSVPKCYKQGNLVLAVSLPSKPSFEYVHRIPASCRKWRKGNPVPGSIVGHPVEEGLESETVKYDHESRGNRTWEWLRRWESAAIVNYRSGLSSEKVPPPHQHSANVWP
jgi:hypothetical protein